MSQSVTLDAKGVYTYASTLSGVPLGSFAVAKNVNINRIGIIEPRRGFNLLAYGLPLDTDRPKTIIFWNGQTFVHYGTTLGIYDSDSGYSSRGSLSAPASANNVRAVASQNKNLYITSDDGLKKTDATGTNLYSAGIPKALTADLAIGSDGGTALPDSSYATYVYLIGRKDANANVQYGGVSGSYITAENSSGNPQDVTVTCYLPSGLDTSYFVQLYRSPSSTTSPPAGDPQLCYETPLTATDITNGYVTITDIVPDSLLGATIYTASSQEGIANDNAQPPLASDIAEYKGCMFYADIESKHRLTFSLISVDGSGLVADDTITLKMGTGDDATTETYTGGAAFDASTKTFVVTTSGSPAQNIDATIKSFIKCVNLSSTIIYAYLVPESDLEPLPGKVNLEARNFGSDSFTAISSRSAAFQPQLVSPATLQTTSTVDASKNGLAFSKNGQPEAVPIKNVFKIGASDDAIKRIVGLRDGLFILKESGGVYLLQGNDESSFYYNLLDSTAKIVAPDSVAVVNNSIYGFFEGGISEVTATGVTIISTPIKDQLLPLFGAPLANVRSRTFALGSDVDGKYILSIPLTADNTSTVKQWVFDVFGRTFVDWDLSLSCGALNPADTKIYLGQGDSGYLKIERRAYDFTDYADFGAYCTITAATGTTVTIDNTTDMAPGDILIQGDAFAYVETVDKSTGTIVIDYEQDWTTDTADVTWLRGINVALQWNPDSAGNAAGLKQYYEASIIFQASFQKAATVYFSSDVNPSEASISLTSSSGNGAFGAFDFGTEVFGGDQASAPRRLGIPRGHCRCSQLSVRFESKVAYSYFQLAGISLSFNPTSTRTTR